MAQYQRPGTSQATAQPSYDGGWFASQQAATRAQAAKSITDRATMMRMRQEHERHDPGVPAFLPGSQRQAQPNSAPAQSYQSSINTGGGIAKHGILSGLLDIGQHSDPNVATLARATAMNDASQIGRGIDSQNQSLRMAQQAKRAELTTEAASNMAKVYGDMAERRTSQIGLAAQVAANNIGFGSGVQAALRPTQVLWDNPQLIWGGSR